MFCRPAIFGLDVIGSVTIFMGSLFGRRTSGSNRQYPVANTFIRRDALVKHGFDTLFKRVPRPFFKETLMGSFRKSFAQARIADYANAGRREIRSGVRQQEFFLMEYIVPESSKLGCNNGASPGESFRYFYSGAAAGPNRNDHRGPGGHLVAWIFEPTKAADIGPQLSQVSLRLTTDQPQLGARKVTLYERPHFTDEPLYSLGVWLILASPDETNPGGIRVKPSARLGSIETIGDYVDTRVATEVLSILFATRRDGIESISEQPLPSMPHRR
jgi:hypothetical protein